MILVLGPCEYDPIGGLPSECNISEIDANTTVEKEKKRSQGEMISKHVLLVTLSSAEFSFSIDFIKEMMYSRFPNIISNYFALRGATKTLQPTMPLSK